MPGKPGWPSSPSRPRSDLLQAGPLLVREQTPLSDPDDTEGFTAGAEQFDSDITNGRYPRAALGVSNDEVIALACGEDRGFVAGQSVSWVWFLVGR